MTNKTHRALVAEDEPMLARALVGILGDVWPEAVVEVVHDGIAAAERALEVEPDVLFLDIQMPGRTGLEVAEMVTDEWPPDRALPLLVFVTAYDEFAIKAFERAAVDYVLKPATRERLADTAARLRDRLAKRAAVPAPGEAATLCGQVQSILAPTVESERIRIIRASTGNTVRMIPAAEVICLEAADKYVTVVTANGEALVRMSLRELATRLEGVDLVQIHRGVMVNAACMTTATRDELGHFSLRLRGLAREVKVSRAFAHLFRPM
ncbi:MAG TPA: LytTR family DNA-binding domain-containing protein [Gammaproteobacteria bacterium]